MLKLVYKVTYIKSMLIKYVISQKEEPTFELERYVN